MLTKAFSAYSFKTLAIYGSVTKSRVFKHLKAGEVKGCGISVPALKYEDIENAAVIVGQMGPEPFLDAMAAEPDFDIIIAGRAYDPSAYIAYCVHQATHHSSSTLESLSSEQLGGFAFMGKIMECGAQCGTPKSASALATIYLDGTFDIIPLSLEARCTPTSVAAHTLYEKSRPDILPGPGGNLNLNNSTYVQLADQRAVRVSGSIFQLSRQNSQPYTIKLEAAKIIGYRSTMMGGIRDPILIKQIDQVISQVKQYCAQQHKEATGTWELEFHVYGANGIMGPLEPGDSSYKPREIFLVAEALASSQALATSVVSCARIACIHGPYPGQRATSGNLAFGVGGKTEIEMGPCAEFCIYHLIPIGVGEEGAELIQDTVTEWVHEEEQNTKRKGLFSWRKLQIGLGDRSTIPPSRTIVNSETIQKRPPASPVQLNLTNPRTLCDIAPVIRSKNSGPYDITLDVMFPDLAVYTLVKHSNLLTRTLIARLYHLKEEEIIWCGFYDQAMAWKATIPRKGLRGGMLMPIASGGFMEADVHGSQQYMGLLELKLSEEVRKGVMKLHKSGGRFSSALGSSLLPILPVVSIVLPMISLAFGYRAYSRNSGQRILK